MTYLISVLAFKIIISLAVLVFPALFRPIESLNRIFGTNLTNTYLFRLYGVAILALLVAYGYGIQLALIGYYPWGIVIMGIVSNGGAVLVMLSLSGWTSQSKGICLFGGIFIALMIAAGIELYGSHG